MCAGEEAESREVGADSKRGVWNAGVGWGGKRAELREAPSGVIT